MHKSFAYIVSIIILVVILGCNNKKEAEVVFKKEQPRKEDTTKTWLSEAENYKKKNKKYFIIFYNYYNQKIKQKEYLIAAETLDRACVLLADSYDFNNKFVATIKEFDTKYRSVLPALKTTFVDAYIANIYFDKSDLKMAANFFKKITVLEPNDYDSCYNTGRAYLIYHISTILLENKTSV